MKKNILNIIVDGKTMFDDEKESYYITISAKEMPEEGIIGKWLQINYENPDEIFKALEIIKTEFGKIDKINIIFNNQKLNMLSYQFDYEFLKNIYFYQTTSLVYLLSLLIPFYREKICIQLVVSEFNHYQIHNKNWLHSITMFLKSMKKDLESKITIDLINCK